jgi:hypothetical protein
MGRMKAMANGSIEDKRNPHREPEAANELKVTVVCPYHEAIIDENRIESALRAALGVPDLRVTAISFSMKELSTS